MLPDETRLDPRVRRTRRLLRTAFIELLAAKSFTDITVQDIAERATVNRATFYAHFEDKYELLDDTIADLARQKLRARLPAQATLSDANLRLLITATCEFPAELHGRCAPAQKQFEPLVEKQVKAQLHAILLEWLTEARPPARPGVVAPELAATVAGWAIYGAAQHWCDAERRVPAEVLAQQTLPMIRAGLAAYLGASA